MVSTQLRSQFQTFGRWIVLGVAAVALVVAFAGPSVSRPHSDAATTVAWRGRFYRGYYGPVVPVVPVVRVAPVYRAPLLRTYYAPAYGPAYYGNPYGGAVVTPYGGVYW